MNRIIISSVAFSIILIIFSSCKQKSEELVEQRRVLIKYTNGKIFCDGFHLIDKMGTQKNRVGIWRFYYPSGTLKNFLQYNKNGDLINEKDYVEDGRVTYSEVVNGNITN